MISAADNHSHTLRDAHAGDPATAGQVEGDPQIFWALEGNDRIACERQIGIAGAAGQDRAVTHERDQPAPRQEPAEVFLVAQQGDVFTQGTPVEVPVQQGSLGDPRQEVGQEPDCLVSADPAPGSGQAHVDTGLDPIRQDGNAGAFQHLLAGSADAHEPAVSRPLRPRNHPMCGVHEPACEEVGDRDSARSVAGQVG